ncbi:MAG: hypothetical protein WCP92_08505 [bacterium]
MEKSTQTNHPRIATRSPEEQIYRNELAQVISSVKEDLRSSSKEDEATQVIQQNILKTLGFTKRAVLEFLKVPFMCSYVIFDTDMSKFT